jgi:hypothetical protein
LIAPGVGPLGGSLLNLSDDDLTELERSGLLESKTPIVEMTESTFTQTNTHNSTANTTTPE